MVLRIKNYLILLALSFLLLLFNGCAKKIVQVWHIKPSTIDVTQNTYTYENDTLKIVYNFWGKKGLLSYDIYNKLDYPMYIDWKKSSYILDSLRLDYWLEDENIIKSNPYKEYLSNYGTPKYNGYGIAFSNGNILREARVTVIPPHSKYHKSQFYIAANSYNYIKDSISFDSASSPIKLRNFLTYSFNKSFENEYYTDNLFYVNKIVSRENQGKENAISFYTNTKVKYRFLSFLEQPKHVFSLSSIIEGSLDGGAIGLNYEFNVHNNPLKYNHLGISIGSYFWDNGQTPYASAKRYIANLDLKFYIGKNDGRRSRFFIGQSILGGRETMLNLHKWTISSSFIYGLNCIILKKIVLNTGVRFGAILFYRQDPKFHYSDYGRRITWGTYLSLGYSF